MSKAGNLKDVWRTIRFLWRWNTGFPMDGQHRTDAGWFTRGKHVYHRTGKVYSWHHWPRIIRMAFRQALNLWILGTLTGLLFTAIEWVKHGPYVADLWLTISLSGLALTGAAIGAMVYGLTKFRHYWQHTHTVTPMALGLADKVGISEQEAEKSLKLEAGYKTIKNGKVGRYLIPGSFGGSPGEKGAVENVIRSRLSQSVTFGWHLAAGKGGYVDFRVAPELPTMARLADHVTEIEKLGKQVYLAGVTTSGTYAAKFIGPEPHHGYCWGTSCGKSTQLASILAQVKHNEPEATGTVIDPKQISLEFMKGIPGIDFYDDPSEFETRTEGLTMDTYLDYMPGMWRGFKENYDLMRYRFNLMAQDRTVEFPTHLLMIEEANSFAIMSKTWWLRNKPKGASSMVPIWGDWIAPIFWRARQANIFIVLSAQSIQERFLGNLNLRPSLGLVSLAKYKPSQYESYIGTTPVPRMQKGQGRALFNDGEKDTWVQCLYATEAEFRAFAMSPATGNQAENVSV